MKVIKQSKTFVASPLAAAIADALTPSQLNDALRNLHADGSLPFESVG